jgi:hypothetical protein
LDPAYFEPGEDRKSKGAGGITSGKSEGSFDDEKIEAAQES